MRITLEEKYREVRRELARRRSAYRRRVANGQMTQMEADRSVEILQAIADDYGLLLDQERRSREQEQR